MVINDTALLLHFVTVYDCMPVQDVWYFSNSTQPIK